MADVQSKLQETFDALMDHLKKHPEHFKDVDPNSVSLRFSYKKINRGHEIALHDDDHLCCTPDGCGDC